MLPEPGEPDLAEISILTDRSVLTRLVDTEAESVRNYVRASSVSLALWFADNWWRLRWEPIPDYQSIGADWRLRHELTSASGGTRWPPLMIYSVGPRIVIVPVPGSTAAPGPAEYLPAPLSLVSGEAFEQGVDDFFKLVVRTCRDAQDGEALDNLVNQLHDERISPTAAAWRRLEARLGYDPDAAPEGLIESFATFEERFGADAVEEAAAGRPGPDSAAALKTVVASSEASTLRVNLEDAVAAAGQAATPDPVRPIWETASDAAERLRRGFGLPGGPFLNKTLSHVLKVAWSEVTNATPTTQRLPYGARLRVDLHGDRIALRTRTGHDRRFELARVLGDAIWTRHSAFGVISRAKTDRQKFQRAFAQSLLCPFEDLARHITLSAPTESEIEAAARRYHVNETVVRTVLVNKRVLRPETLDQQLEAA
jgi:hypothetical protein